MDPTDPTVTQLIFLESGGFAGLQRGCTVEPSALPDAPRHELQSLVQQTSREQASTLAPVPNMPDMQTYTLELVMQPADQNLGAAPPLPGKAQQQQQAQHRVLHFPASDVPNDVSLLIDFLRDQARPIEQR
jgi:hypothetical protein